MVLPIKWILFGRTFTQCYLFFGILLKKKSGIFVSFPFSTFSSEVRLTYVNVGVAENWFLKKIMQLH